MRPLAIAPDRLARLRAICLALPEATENVAWGDPTWRVRDKIFAMQKGNDDGGRPSVWLKVEGDGQGMLVETQPALFFVPPYLGHKGWVGIYMDAEAVPWALVEELVRESYRLVAPKRLAARLGEAPPPPKPRRPIKGTGR